VYYFRDFDGEGKKVRVYLSYIVALFKILLWSKQFNFCCYFRWNW